MTEPQKSKNSQEIWAKPINFEEKWWINSGTKIEKKKKISSESRRIKNEWKKFIKYNILQEIENWMQKEETQREKKTV